MSKTKEEYKKILSKYQKEEIIDAVLTEIVGFEISYVLNKLWREKHEKLYRAMEQAGKEDTKALQAYADFEKELASKYGKDGKLNLNVIPPQDFKKLQGLLMEWDKARKKYVKASKTLDRFYEENEQ